MRGRVRPRRPTPPLATALLLIVALAAVAAGNGPWPTLVMLHPWGTSKTLFEATSPDNGKTAMMGDQYTNNNFARQGYLVINFTSRAVFGSCGAVLGDVLLQNGLGNLHCPSDDFLHFADTRYEVRDAQYLVGRLVDDGLAKPGFAVTGESYGAGQTLLHSVLRYKMVLPDGRTVPLVSPKGVPWRSRWRWPPQHGRTSSPPPSTTAANSTPPSTASPPP